MFSTWRLREGGAAVACWPGRCLNSQAKACTYHLCSHLHFYEILCSDFYFGRPASRCLLHLPCLQYSTVYQVLNSFPWPPPYLTSGWFPHHHLDRSSSIPAHGLRVSDPVVATQIDLNPLSHPLLYRLSWAPGTALDVLTRL